jgi:hypothetical protein
MHTYAGFFIQGDPETKQAGEYGATTDGKVLA